MQVENNEEELIARCRKGERRAWCELVRRYDRFVYSVAISTGLTVDDAADVTQITFSALLDGLDRLRPGSRLASWLATVARRQAWRVLAQRKREPTGLKEDVAWSVAESYPDPDDETGRWDQLHALLMALERLDARCRNLITALYFELDQPSYEDIARQFGMPMGSIGPTRARCLERLRKAFVMLGVDHQ